MSIYRIPFILAAAACLQKSLTSPTARVSQEKLLRQEGVLERMIMFDGSGFTTITSNKVAFRLNPHHLILISCSMIHLDFCLAGRIGGDCHHPRPIEIAASRMERQIDGMAYWLIGSTSENR